MASRPKKSAAPDTPAAPEAKPDLALLPRLFPYSPPKGDPLPYPAPPAGVHPAAEAVLEFLSGFNIPEGRRAGEPISRETLPEYLHRALELIFGHRDSDGRRIITNGMFAAARKNAKSWLAALVGIAFLYSEQERAGEILIVASSQKQARRIFELITRTLRSNPKRWGQLRVQDVASSLTHLTTQTTLRAMAADPARLYGLSPSVLLLDELHVWTGEKGQKLWSSLTTGMGARPDRLTMTFTTVPDSPPSPAEVFSQQLSYALKVQSGEVDDRRFLPMLFLPPADADPHDERTWAKANPGLGSVLDLAELREDYRRELQTDPGLTAFRSMRLNMIPRSALDARWLSPAMIERARRPAPVTLERLTACDRCVIGLDHGGSYDLASVVVLGDNGEEVLALQRSWISAAGFERIAAAVPEIRDMRDRGELTVTGGEAVPADVIVDDVADIAHLLGISEVGLDPAMSQLLAGGLRAHGLALVEARQGAVSMSPVMSWLEEALSEGALDIGTDNLLAWAMGNVAQASSTIGRRPVKAGDDESTNPRKIDPISAMLSAAQLLLEARNAEVSGAGDGIEWIDPYSDPVNAAAVLEGGAAIDLRYGAAPPMHPLTRGWIIYG
jgi:phage terminase large subunit-like protein